MKVIRENKLFRRILGASFVSTLGDSMYYIALLTYAKQFENSSLAILLVSCSETIPNLFYVITGNLADQTSSKGKRMIQLSIFRGILYVLVGFLIGFEQSMLLLVGIVFLNFMSDIAGKYSSGLLSPFFVLIVGEEDIEAASGLNSAIITFINVIAQFVGAALIAVLSYQMFAWLNSLTFLLNALIIFSILGFLNKAERSYLQGASEKSQPGDFWRKLKLSFELLRVNKGFFKLLLQFTLLNGLLSTSIPLLSMWLALYPEQALINFSFTIALTSATSAIGIILGNMLNTSLLKKLTMNQLLLPTFACLLAFFVALLVGNVPLVMLFNFSISFLVGGIQPKLTGRFYHEFPLEQLATVGGMMNTLLTVASPAISLLFLTIATSFSIHSALILLASAVCISILLSLQQALTNKKLGH